MHKDDLPERPTLQIGFYRDDPFDMLVYRAFQALKPGYRRQFFMRVCRTLFTPGLSPVEARNIIKELVDNAIPRPFQVLEEELRGMQGRAKAPIPQAPMDDVPEDDDPPEDEPPTGGSLVMYKG